MLTQTTDPEVGAVDSFGAAITLLILRAKPFLVTNSDGPESGVPVLGEQCLKRAHCSEGGVRMSEQHRHTTAPDRSPLSYYSKIPPSR